MGKQLRHCQVGEVGWVDLYALLMGIASRAFGMVPLKHCTACLIHSPLLTKVKLLHEKMRYFSGRWQMIALDGNYVTAQWI